ncbi:MAG: hypothetical protein ACKVX9_03990 [Blastocatellia bacterium]
MRKVYRIVFILTGMCVTSLIPQQGHGQHDQRPELITAYSPSSVIRILESGQERKSVLTDEAEFKKQKAEDFKLLLINARNAPPEIAADTLIQLLGVGGIGDLAIRREMAKEAFNLAYSTQYRVKMYDVIDDADSRNRMLSYGYSLEMDTLSLQCRSVKEMLAIDKQAAREMFEEIVLPELPPLSCEGAMVYDVSLYYAVLANILKSAYTKEEVEKNARVQLLSRIMARVSSVAELSPAIKVILGAELQPADFGMVVQLISSRMANLPKDPRAFSSSARAVGGDVRLLAEHCKRLGVSNIDLLGSYRSLLRDNLTSVICKDHEDVGKAAEWVNTRAEAFNSLLADLDPEGKTRISRLNGAELTPKSIGAAPKIDAYWKSPMAEKLLAEIGRLNFGQNRKKVSLAEREQEKWQRELTESVGNLRSWSNHKDESVSEIDYFHQKCNLYELLIQITPKSSSQLDGILSDYIGFLSYARSQKESLIEWQWQARVPLLTLGYTKQSPDSVLKRYTESGDRLLRLIAEAKLFIAKYKSPNSVIETRRTQQ